MKTIEKETRLSKEETLGAVSWALANDRDLSRLVCRSALEGGLGADYLNDPLFSHSLPEFCKWLNGEIWLTKHSQGIRKKESKALRRSIKKGMDECREVLKDVGERQAILAINAFIFSIHNVYHVWNYRSKEDAVNYCFGARYESPHKFRGFRRLATESPWVNMAMLTSVDFYALREMDFHSDSWFSKNKGEKLAPGNPI